MLLTEKKLRNIIKSVIKEAYGNKPDYPLIQRSPADVEFEAEKNQGKIEGPVDTRYQMNPSIEKINQSSSMTCQEVTDSLGWQIQDKNKKGYYNDQQIRKFIIGLGTNKVGPNRPHLNIEGGYDCNSLSREMGIPVDVCADIENILTELEIVPKRYMGEGKSYNIDVVVDGFANLIIVGLDRFKFGQPVMEGSEDPLVYDLKGNPLDFKESVDMDGELSYLRYA